MAIVGKPMLARLVDGDRKIPRGERVLLPKAEQPGNRPILQFAAERGLQAYTGNEQSEEDVLDRVYQTARAYDVSVIVRVSPDCPLMDPSVSGRVLLRFLEAQGTLDYASNTQPPTFPDGLATDAFSFSALTPPCPQAH